MLLINKSFFNISKSFKPYFTPSLQGDYVFGLEVSDGVKTSTEDSVNVGIRGNLSPTYPNISPADNPGAWEGNPITFTANGSNDVDRTFIYNINLKI